MGEALGELVSIWTFYEPKGDGNVSFWAFLDEGKARKAAGDNEVSTRKAIRLNGEIFVFVNNKQNSGGSVVVYKETPLDATVDQGSWFKDGSLMPDPELLKAMAK